MDDIDIRKELYRSIISVVRHKEFYGHVVQQFQKVFVRNPHRIDTAGVGRSKGDRFIKLFYNEDYIQGLYDEQLAEKSDYREAIKHGRLYASGVSEHEILHVVSNHLVIMYPDPIRGNVAKDCVVNQYIDEDRRHPTWIMPQRYDLPPFRTSK